jgi:hypothetical protein
MREEWRATGRRGEFETVTVDPEDNRLACAEQAKRPTILGAGRAPLLPAETRKLGESVPYLCPMSRRIETDHACGVSTQRPVR